MTPPRDTLARIDHAMACFDQALEALGQIPKEAVPTVVVDGIAHGLRELAQRMRTLRDEVAGEGDGAETDAG
jgi:hypothetical protein